MTKTLIFCTAYSASSNSWIERYAKWLSYYENRAGINYDQILIIDDGSPSFPTINDINIVDRLNDGYEDRKKVLFHFKNNLGRPESLIYPGWYRSFAFAAIWAKRYGFDKVVHIESDAYVLTRKLANFINELDSGWTTLWCPRSSFPETCIQVIGSDSLNSFFDFAQMSYENFSGTCIETLLWRGDLKRFTNVCQEFEGDRYSQYPQDVPPSADYACQCPDNWLPSGEL